jgi:hypothetical protein
LDLASLGLWYGLKSDELNDAIHYLWLKSNNKPYKNFSVSENFSGNKVTIPIFSRGLQGFVSGIFYDVPKASREPILTSLMQFGETLGDVYADLRMQHFCERLDQDLNDEMLARELINLISPVAKLIVERGSRIFGYKLAYEEKYFAGYSALTSAEVEQVFSDHSFTVDGPFGIRIHVEPLTDIPNFNPDFAKMRLESCLKHTLGSIDVSTNGPSLPFSEVRQLRLEFELHLADSKASLAKLRQYYVIQKIEKFWHKSSVTITNVELKNFLEEQGRTVKTGYQVTSFAAEFEKIFSEKVAATKNRNALSFAWNKGHTSHTSRSDSRNT